MNSKYTQQMQIIKGMGDAIKRVNDQDEYKKRVKCIRSMYLYGLRNFDKFYYTNTNSLMTTYYDKIPILYAEMIATQNDSSRNDQPSENYHRLVYATFNKYKCQYETLYLLLYSLIPDPICHDNKQIIMGYLF